MKDDALFLLSLARQHINPRACGDDPYSNFYPEERPDDELLMRPSGYRRFVDRDDVPDPRTLPNASAEDFGAYDGGENDDVEDLCEPEFFGESGVAGNFLDRALPLAAELVLGEAEPAGELLPPRGARKLAQASNTWNGVRHLTRDQSRCPKRPRVDRSTIRHASAA